MWRKKALPEHMLKASYEIEVLVNGKPLKEYAHNGKVYIEGREKTVFSLRLRNNSYKQKLFVPTIDGLSIMDGKDASYKSSGYIVRGNSSLTIEGWRVSDSKVAEFYFSEPKNSYRKRMKKGNNLGVIGCAVFDEKPAPYVGPTVIIQKEYVYPRPFHCTCPGYCYIHSGSWYSTSTGPNVAWGGSTLLSQANCGASGTGSSMSLNASNTVNCSSVTCGSAGGGGILGELREATQALGTGWGEQKKSEVVTVEFDQKETPAEVFEIYYNTRQELEKMGINFNREPHYVTPVAFPGQYCEPPQN